MNAATVLVLLAVLGLLGLALRKLHRQRGRSGCCSGDCSHCGGGQCSRGR